MIENVRSEKMLDNVSRAGFARLEVKNLYSDILKKLLYIMKNNRIYIKST